MRHVEQKNVEKARREKRLETTEFSSASLYDFKVGLGCRKEKEDGENKKRKPVP